MQSQTPVSGAYASFGHAERRFESNNEQNHNLDAFVPRRPDKRKDHSLIQLAGDRISIRVYQYHRAPTKATYDKQTRLEALVQFGLDPVKCKSNSKWDIAITVRFRKTFGKNWIAARYVYAVRGCSFQKQKQVCHKTRVRQSQCRQESVPTDRIPKQKGSTTESVRPNVYWQD